MPEIIKISPINIPVSIYQEYNENDKNLIEHFSIEEDFNPSTDRIEYVIKNLQSNIIFSENNR